MNKFKSIIVALLLFVTPQLSHALTGSDIISRARIYLRDTSADTTRQRFSDAQLLQFLNDGQREANALGFVLQSSYTFSLVGGTTEYTLPSDYLATWRVTLNNRKLDQTSFNQQDANSVAWQAQSPSQPINYYVYLAANPVIGFVPAPSSTYVTQSTPVINVWYIQQTRDLTTTTQVPFNGWAMLYPYHSGLAYYIAYRGLWAAGDNELATQYQTEWNIWLSTLKVGIGKQPDFNPGMGGRRTQ